MTTGILQTFMRARWFAIFLGLAAILCAQAPTGQISGSVTDPSGAVITGAAVTATNQATSIHRETVTNDDGLFNLSALPPGIYSLVVDAKGFPKQNRDNIELQVRQG